VLIWGSGKNDTEEKLYQRNLIIKKTDWEWTSSNTVAKQVDKLIYFFWKRINAKSKQCIWNASE
jgi:hypothetical protein